MIPVGRAGRRDASPVASADGSGAEMKMKIPKIVWAETLSFVKYAR